MNEYDIGDRVRLTATFAIAGVATDPSTVTAYVRRPDSIVSRYVYGTDAALEKTGTGAYRLDYDPVVPGVHWYRFVGTGTAVAAEEESFTVKTANATE